MNETEQRLALNKSYKKYKYRQEADGLKEEIRNVEEEITAGVDLTKSLLQQGNVELRIVQAVKGK